MNVGLLLNWIVKIYLCHFPGDTELHNKKSGVFNFNYSHGRKCWHPLNASIKLNVSPKTLLQSHVSVDVCFSFVCTGTTEHKTQKMCRPQKGVRNVKITSVSHRVSTENYKVLNELC